MFKKTTILVGLGLALLFTSCELINFAPGDLEIIVRNSTGDITLQNLSVAVTYTQNADTATETLTAGSLSPGGELSAVVAIDKKSFYLSPQVTIIHDGTPEEGIVIQDSVGVANYHSFRALAALNAVVQVTISGSGAVTIHEVDMGYAEDFD